MSRNNFILAVGDRNSEELSTIKEIMNSFYWGYYDVGESGKEATNMYLESGSHYDLVVMAGGFAWEEDTKTCPIQSLVLISYMRMWYKSEKMDLPTVIVYEPEENKRQRLCEMLEREMWTGVTIMGSREKIIDKLNNWWYEHTSM